MVPRTVSQGASRYIVGEVTRFDQKNEMFCRSRWDQSLKDTSGKLWEPERPDENIPGFTMKDFALEDAAWYIPITLTSGSYPGNRGLYTWDTKVWGTYGRPKMGIPMEVKDSAKMSRQIKKIARYLGASAVGICELDRRWLYSHEYDIHNGAHTPLELPQDYKYAIVLGYEMKYELIKMSPARTHGFGVGMVYTQQAAVGRILAQFIKQVGYKAIPMGNDTANSIPLAIDAGLGELGRLGLLISPQVGPRMRLSKVFTNLPLAVDKPIDFGVWEFCRRCKKCAKNCPGQAISSVEPTDQPNNISNRTGIKRWPINGEKCLAWFAKNQGDCSNCIRVCPFNKPRGLIHDWVKWGVQNAPLLDGLFIKMDEILGYGKRVKADTFWEE